MSLKAFAQTDIGNVRKRNEDFHLVDAGLGLFIVCDGVGGHKAGDVASESAAKAIHKHVSENRAVIDKFRASPTQQGKDALAELVKSAMQAANAAVYAMSESDVSKKGMASTCCTVLAVEDFATVGHVGDSRVYLLRGGKHYQLTEDHKVSTEMMKQGVWTAEEAEKSPYANVITRSIGHEKFVQVDTFQLELIAHDTLLMCSDGLYRYFEGDEISTLVMKSEPDKAAQNLVNFAKSAGGNDNITVVLAHVLDDKKVNEALNAMKRGEILGKVPLFQYLSYPELLKVLNLVNMLVLGSGATLIKEGSPGNEMFVVVSGGVDVMKGGQVIAKMGKGDFFGEMCFFDRAPRSASIVVSEPATLLALARKDFLPLLRKEPELAVKFLWAVNQVLNQRLRNANKELVEAKTSLLVKADLPFDSK